MTAIPAGPHGEGGRGSRRPKKARTETVNRVETRSVSGNVVQAGTIGTVILGEAPTALEQPVPMQVPVPPRAFVGRDRELHVLDEWGTQSHADQPPQIIVINGISGIGKSALASYWCWVNRSKFSGGQLYVDMDAYRNEGVVAVEDVAAAFLRAVGVHDHFIPARFAERASLFRSMTASRPYLVLIDNADQSAQVRPLLPGASGSVVLVTSRNRLSGLRFNGAEFIDLLPFDSAASYRLMRSLVPDHLQESLHTGDVAEIIEFCGGLPVAVRIAAARLGERNRWTPATLLAHLADARHRLDRFSLDERTFTSVFDAALSSLPSPVRRVYCALGEHPGVEFDALALAFVTGIAAVYAEESFAELFEANLVEAVSPGRYRFHDLVRLHARAVSTRMDGKQRDEHMTEKFELWYLAGAVAADLAVAGPHRWRVGASPLLPVWPTSFTPISAMEWYEAERVNLLSMVRSAAVEGRNSVVMRFCESLWPFFYAKKYYADWIECHRLGIAAAVGDGDVVSEARMRNQLARAYIELQRLDEADTELCRAGVAVREARVPRAEAVVAESKGVVEAARGQHDKAAGWFSQALAVNRQIGDRRGTALQSYHLASVLVRGGGELTDALRLLDEARRIAREIEDEMTVARVGIVLGMALRLRDQFAEAADALDEAARTMRERGQPVKELEALEQLVVIAEEVGDTALAERVSRRMTELRRETGSPEPITGRPGGPQAGPDRGDPD